MAVNESDVAAEQARAREGMEPVKPEEAKHPGEGHEHGEYEPSLKEFNSLPEILKTWYFDNVNVQMKRTSAEYDPDRKMLTGSIRFYIVRPGHPAVEFEPKDYITRFGSQTKRKFISLFSPIIGNDMADQVSNHVVEFNDARESFLEKYHIGREATTVIRQPITRAR